MKFGALCLRGWAALFLAILAGPASGEPIPGQTYADIEFHAEAEPQTDPAGGSVVLLYWSNPGRNSYRVQSSDDLETWATVLEGYSFADDQSFVPVYIAAPSVGVAPPKPLRTVSLRETTTGWFASWVDVVNDDPVWCLQPLAVPPPEFDGYIHTAEAASHRLVFTRFRVSDPSLLPPPPWAEIPALASLPALAQTTFQEIVATLAAYQGSIAQATPAIPPPDANAARIFYRVTLLTDSDGDGLSDAEEMNAPDGPGGQPLHSPPFQTDPFDADSDHDGRPDGDELAGGSDPLNAASQPPLAADGLVLDIRRRHFSYGFWPSFGGTEDQLSWMTFQAPDVTEPSFIGTTQLKPSQSPTPAEVMEDMREMEPYDPRGTLTLDRLDHEPLPVAVGGGTFYAQCQFSNRPGDTESFMYGSESQVYLRLASRRSETFRRTLAFITTAQRNGTAEPPHFDSHTFIVPAGRWSSPGFEIPVYIPDGATLGSSSQVGDDSSTHSITKLLPVELHSAVELYTDLNNDGTLTSADSGLTGKPYASGASDDEKDKGTEFIFANDSLSNGAWDKEENDTPGKPSDADDDDAEEIVIKPGITEGEVWLDHPAIAGLKFYKQRKCTEEIQLSPSNHFTISSSNPFPNQVFVRADNVQFSSTTNPQVEGDLKLIIKPTGGAAAGIEAAKMKVTFIKGLGATKYFHGARDYIFENNARTFTHHKDYGSRRYRIVAMREESTVMFGMDTYDHAADKPRLKGIDALKGNYNSDVIINGNQCFATNGVPFTDNPYPGGMTNRCDGRLCVGKQILRPPSDDTHNPNLGGPGARYVGYTTGEPEMVNGQLIIPSLFTFATGQIPEGVPATPDQGIGGLAAKYDRAELQQSENQAIGRARVSEPGKGIVFTATTYVGDAGNAISLAADAHNSGVQPLNGGAAGAWELLFLDGSSSVGLVLSNPNGHQQTVIKGGKHNGAPYYYINTYLLFECEKPRR